MPKHSAVIGSVSSGTLRSEDLLSAFASELDFIGEEADYELIAEANALLEADELDEDKAAGLVEELIDALSEHAPPYCYFGAIEGDGADFGFWPSWEAIDELPKFDDLADVPDDIDEDYTIVNDHGNVTLYSANGNEIWGVV